MSSRMLGGRKVRPGKRSINTVTTSANNSSNGGNSHSNVSGNILRPPRHTRKEHIMKHFDDNRSDPFYWMRDRRNPEVRRLLQRENAYMDSVLAAYGGDQLCRTLFSEMRGRWKEEDASLPYHDRGYWYYTRTVPNAEYPIFCRRPFTEGTRGFMHEVADMWNCNPTATLPHYDDEVVYLDVNLFVKELRLRSVELGDVEVSPDEQRLAVTLDCSNGKELFTIFLLDIKDVNYMRWFRERSELHRAWAEAMLRSDQSIYTASITSLPVSRSPITPTTPTTTITTTTSTSTTGISTVQNNSGNSGSENVGSHGITITTNDNKMTTTTTATTTKKKNGKKKENKIVMEQSSLSSSIFTVTTNISSTPSSSSLSTSASRAVEPVHKITRRIDVFDSADEVLWLSPTSLLYLGVDEKMRSCRVIYHNLNTPVQAEHTDLICYEEFDETFWVSSLCFSADGRFAMFTVSSGSCTEVYVIPCDTDMDRCVHGVPLVHITGNGERKGEGESVETNTINTAQSPVYCFTNRASCMDYDIDHHKSLFGEGIGAWVVTMTNAPPPGHPVDFRVAYVLDDDLAYNNSDISTCSLSDPFCWRPLFIHDPSIAIEGVECMQDYLLLSVRRAASATVLLLPIRTLWDRWHNRDRSNNLMMITPLSLQDEVVDLRSVVCRPFPPSGELSFSITQLLKEKKEQRHELDNDGTPEGFIFNIMNSTDDVSFKTRTWRVTVMHLTVPTVIIACTLDETNEDTLILNRLCAAGVCGTPPYNPDEYDATVVWVPSDYAFFRAPTSSPSPSLLSPLPTKEPAEVVKIPVYVCWKKALRRHGENPMFLTVYGSYGDCCDIVFETERLALLDRGFVWAVAGVRGGGELGIPWRDAGRGLQRSTSVNDFVSVSSFLQETGWCAAGQLVTHGSSAGGFVVAAAMCAAPSLPLAVVASVPFVDCLTTLLDADLPLTVCEWEEFGNPRDDEEAYRLLRAASPMDNIPPAGVALPHVLLLTAWHDTRVGFWESLAFTARLRMREEEEKGREEGEGNDKTATAAEKRMVLHYCDFAVGHGGSTGRYERLREIAREYTFALLIQQFTGKGIDRKLKESREKIN